MNCGKLWVLHQQWLQLSLGSAFHKALTVFMALKLHVLDVTWNCRVTPYQLDVPFAFLNYNHNPSIYFPFPLCHVQGRREVKSIRLSMGSHSEVSRICYLLSLIWRSTDGHSGLVILAHHMTKVGPSVISSSVFGLFHKNFPWNEHTNQSVFMLLLVDHKSKPKLLCIIIDLWS